MSFARVGFAAVASALALGACGSTGARHEESRIRLAIADVETSATFEGPRLAEEIMNLAR